MVADVEALKGLLERVRAAEGPDKAAPGAWERTLDADFFEAFGGPAWDAAYRSAQRSLGVPHDVAVKESRLYAPRFTGSVDAAFALMERALPGWDVCLYYDDNQYVAEMTWPDGTDIGEAEYFGIIGRAPTRPLAILCGVLDGCVQVASADAETEARRAALIAQAESEQRAHREREGEGAA